MNEMGDTPLWIAYWHGQLGVLKWLGEGGGGGDVQVVDENGCNLWFAASSICWTWACWMWTRGITVGRWSECWWRRAVWMWMYGHGKVVQVLVEAVHPRTKAVCVWEKSLMAVVSRDGGVDVVEVLVKAGVGVGGRGCGGQAFAECGNSARECGCCEDVGRGGRRADVKQTWAGGGDTFECVFFRV